MVRTAQELITLDPREMGTEHGRDVAPRPTTLDGKVIGLLSNSKPNSEELMRMVAGLLRERYSIRSVIEADKGTNRWPEPPEMIEDLASRCDAVLTATAD